MKKLFTLLICLLLLFALVSCGDDPMHTHSYTVKNTNGNYLASAADCENAATYFYSCSCGDKGTETFTSGSANGHTTQGNTCIYCGRLESSEGLAFALNKDGKGYTLTGKGSFTGSHLIIDLYNNLPVTSIVNYAFRNCTSLTSVTIGNSVTSIGNYAFRYCTSLTRINYRGSEAEWEAIEKESNWNLYTSNYTIIYNYTGE